MKPLVKESIARIAAYQPGKPLEELEREYGITGAIKLASNENPLGPSPKALDAIRDALPRVNRYPDIHAFYLKEKLARKLGVTPDNLIMGNGSDEIIQLIAQTFLMPGEEVIMGDPTFSFYRIVVVAAGGMEVLVPLRNFSYDLAAMASSISPQVYSRNWVTGQPIFMRPRMGSISLFPRPSPTSGRGFAGPLAWRSTSRTGPRGWSLPLSQGGKLRR